mgnify:CR=1 FL=1
MNCRFCNNTLEHVFVDLGEAPPSNSFLNKEDLNKKEVFVRNPNIIKFDKLPAQMEVLCKIRYKDKGSNSTLTTLNDGRLKIEFYDDVQGVAPGQSAVFYDDNDLIGGGFIDN